MCKPASFVLTKKREFWSRSTDSHDEIIREYGLAADGVGGPNVLRVEVTPPNGRYDVPLSEWAYRVDQDVLPPWHDAVDCERRARLALVEWARAQLVRDGDNRVVNDDDNIVAVIGGTVQAVRGGVVRFFAAFSIRLAGAFSVAIDMRGKTAICHVGTDAERIVS